MRRCSTRNIGGSDSALVRMPGGMMVASAPELHGFDHIVDTGGISRVDLRGQHLSLEGLESHMAVITRSSKSY